MVDGLHDRAAARLTLALRSGHASPAPWLPPMVRLLPPIRLRDLHRLSRGGSRARPR